MGKGHGYGKTILFGEHFVVYGLPALASAIGSKTSAIVEKKASSGYELFDNRPEVPGYKKKKFDEQKVSLKNVLNFMGINTDKQGLKITFGGDLVCASGVGASAASCVSLARAINDEFNLGWDDVKINDAAYEGEKGYHGTPSGIDNTASTFGGLVYFIRNLEGGPNTIETIKLEKPFELVIASSGMTANTKDVVADVRKLKEKDPDWFEGIVKKYQEVVKEGLEALKKMDLEHIGQLMDKNHSLLQEITVSNDVLDKMVKIAKDTGALGAKLTGTGRGGNMISLTPGSELQDKVARALENAGYSVWKTTIGA
ncbi:MAG: mevalonate kinase [Candidatus Hermodarchaeota archaeon]